MESDGKRVPGPVGSGRTMGCAPNSRKEGEMTRNLALKLAAAVVVASVGTGAAGLDADAQGFPKLIDPAVDLGAQTPGPELGWADSIYITSRVDAGGHEIGILLHVVSI